MAATSVVRWQRYGKDRLYVRSRTGATLGWHDVTTGEDHIHDAAQADHYRAAIAAWKAPIPEQRPAAAPTHAPASSVAWTDLAAQPAGALARQQAVALRQAAPVRTLAARVFGVHTDERAWRIGADGEEKVGKQLTRLRRKDARWHVLHAIQVGSHGSDIDHVVIGPGGVYSLNAKHHPDAAIWVGGETFMVNGNRTPYIRNSRHEAARASRLLSHACGFPVPVTGVVVPVGADRLTIKTPPRDVHVVNRMALARWLRKRPLTLADAAIDAIYAVARRSTTWQLAVTAPLGQTGRL